MQDRINEIRGRYQQAVIEAGCPNGRIDQDTWDDVASDIGPGACRTFVKGAPADTIFLLDQVAALTAQNAALVKALDRLLGNSRRIFDKTPVRDWCETLAEAERALSLTPADALKRREREDEERRLMEAVCTELVSCENHQGWAKRIAMSMLTDQTGETHGATTWLYDIVGKARMALEALEAHRKESGK